jgi:hypothetical protein
MLILSFCDFFYLKINKKIKIPADCEVQAVIQFWKCKMFVQLKFMVNLLHAVYGEGTIFTCSHTWSSFWVACEWVAMKKRQL